MKGLKNNDKIIKNQMTKNLQILILKTLCLMLLANILK